MRTWLIHLFVTTCLFTAIAAEVYICKGPSSQKYHKTETCRGLSNCSTKIYKVSLKEAVDEWNRTQCRAGCYD